MARASVPILKPSARRVQNSHGVQYLQVAEPKLLAHQAEVLLNDIRPDAFKLGALASAEVVQVVASVIRQYPDIPVVLDPVLAAGGGGKLSRDGLSEAVIEELLPLTTLCTPNTLEVAELGNSHTEEDAVAKILQRGCQAVLLTGSHRESHGIHHQLYQAGGLCNDFRYERLKHEYYGSGCTLASALAAFLAQDNDLVTASEQALKYCFDSLASAYLLGGGQHFPNRIFPDRPFSNSTFPSHKK